MHISVFCVTLTSKLAELALVGMPNIYCIADDVKNNART